MTYEKESAWVLYVDASFQVCLQYSVFLKVLFAVSVSLVECRYEIEGMLLRKIQTVIYE